MYLIKYVLESVNHALKLLLYTCTTSSYFLGKSLPDSYSKINSEYTTMNLFYITRNIKISYHEVSYVLITEAFLENDELKQSSKLLAS
jgi:hypothetical protein